MFREIILPIFRSTRLCVTACGIMHPRCCRPVAGNIYFVPRIKHIPFQFKKSCQSENHTKRLNAVFGRNFFMFSLVLHIATIRLYKVNYRFASHITLHNHSSWKCCCSSLAISAAVFPYGERTYRPVGLSASGQRGWSLFQGIGETLTKRDLGLC